MTVGENIKRIRKEKGLTQKKLGELCGINEVQIRRYELGGKNSNPKIETLKRIADALDTPLILFVEDDLLDAATWMDGDSEEELIDNKINEIMNNSEMSLEEKKAKAKELMTQLEIMSNYHLDNANRAYEFMLNKLIRQLNHTGKDKALEHVEMLTKIPEYRQDTNPEKE
ncbi:MAG: helix-turn-helix domain-containing protein [Roseburia sp.]